jgi:hypothetical protein
MTTNQQIHQKAQETLESVMQLNRLLDKNAKEYSCFLEKSGIWAALNKELQYTLKFYTDTMDFFNKAIEEQEKLRTKSPREIEIGPEDAPYLPRVEEFEGFKIHTLPCGCEECRNRPETELRKTIAKLIEEQVK